MTPEVIERIKQIYLISDRPANKADGESDWSKLCQINSIAAELLKEAKIDLLPLLVLSHKVK